MKGPLTQALRFKTVLLSELRRDNNPRRWQGKQITIPVIDSMQAGAQMINAETGTINTPQVLDHGQANIKSAFIELGISFTPQVIEQARGDDTSWAEVVPLKMRLAEDAIGRTINEQMNGDGTALLAAVTSATGSGTLVVPVGTAANFYQLYAGRIVDIRTRANGNDPGQGLLRKIASYDEVAGTVTFLTTAFGGGSGGITFSANEGIYIQGSYGNAMAGLAQIAATSGQFQGRDKTNVFVWQGTDASPGALTDPSLATFDRAERKSYQKSGRTPDFYLVDPAVIDKYSQGIATAARWNGDQVELETGFTGVRYRNKLLMVEYDAAARTAYGVAREDLALYTLDDGPDWDDKTGAIFQRFARTMPVEAWLTWLIQMGAFRCNTTIKVGNLNQAA